MKAYTLIKHAVLVFNVSLFTSSCEQLDSESEPAPVYYTPISAKVDLTGVSMGVTNVQLIQKAYTTGDKYFLSFDFHVLNQSEQSIAFACLKNRLHDLIEVNITDAEGKTIPLVRDPLDELTLAQPKPLVIRTGLNNDKYEHIVGNIGTEAGQPVHLRIRLHTPSRYDELRSSLEAPLTTVTWP